MHEAPCRRGRKHSPLQEMRSCPSSACPWHNDAHLPTTDDCCLSQRTWRASTAGGVAAAPGVKLHTHHPAVVTLTESNHLNAAQHTAAYRFALRTLAGPQWQWQLDSFHQQGGCAGAVAAAAVGSLIQACTDSCQGHSLQSRNKASWSLCWPTCRSATL